MPGSKRLISLPAWRELKGYIPKVRFDEVNDAKKGTRKTAQRARQAT